MSSISPHPDGVSGGDHGGGDGTSHDAGAQQGGYGAGPSGSPGYLPGATSSGSAAFASTPPGNGPPPAAQQGRPPQGYGQPQGAPQGGYGSPPGTYGQPPNPYGRPAPYGQPPQAPPPHPSPQHQAPPPMPSAPHATRPEPHRDMPMAGASPIRRNIDDTAELPAFLDSARSDESPNAKPAAPEAKKGVTRKFPLTTGFTALLRHRHALSVLVKRDLAVKYQSTVMGYVWSLIEPLGLAAIYWFVFGVLFSRQGDLPEGVGFPLFIISGIFAWQWFTSALGEGTKSLGGQSALITVMKVPREVFPVSKVFARFAEYVVGFPIIIAMAILYGGVFGINLLWLIPAILVQAMLLTGIVFILAGLNVLYKDVQRFLSLVTRILFYSSAIIFPVTRVAEELKDHELIYRIYSMNPLVGIFQMHRAVWIPSFQPDLYQLGSAVGFAVFFLFFGRWIFYRLEPRVLKAL
ncbi:MAG TPA: ABC transporter permease [Glycomyces sp.]|nr:ABC transporter permease [Glycomyces sp.]